jgi:hypothetical protein
MSNMFNNVVQTVIAAAICGGVATLFTMNGQLHDLSSTLDNHSKLLDQQTQQFATAQKDREQERLELAKDTVEMHNQINGIDNKVSWLKKTVDGISAALDALGDRVTGDEKMDHHNH